MQMRASPAETSATRLGLVLGAECTFATLVRLVTGIPPDFIVTVVFGIALALTLAVQAHRSGGTALDRWLRRQ